MNKLVITQIPLNETPNVTTTALMDDFKLKQVSFEKENSINIGNIYVGKVKKIVQNIQAAFVEIAPNEECYLPLSDLKTPIYLNKKSSKSPLVAGDELLVQICKEAMKTKACVLTTNLSFSGKNVVLTSQNRQIGISKKIDLEKGTILKNTVKNYISSKNDFAYGVIIRTNAKNSTTKQIVSELDLLYEVAEQTIKYGIHRTCFSKIYSANQEYIEALKNSYMANIEEIITDNRVIFEKIKNYLTIYQPEDLIKLRLFKENTLPLYKLYNIQNQIYDALNKRVWLKSGGYLIIEQTEAMIVVDVNTGKFDGRKKNKEENFLKINKEAAKELVQQLILRNLSGMILVDFISMESEEYNKELIEFLIHELKKDSIKSEFVDITKLGIVEITRKKQKKTLYENINDF